MALYNRYERTQLGLFQQTAMPPPGSAHSRGVILARHRAILVMAMRERMAQYDALSDALGRVGTQLSALQREAHEGEAP